MNIYIDEAKVIKCLDYLKFFRLVIIFIFIFYYVLIDVYGITQVEIYSLHFRRRLYVSLGNAKCQARDGKPDFHTTKMSYNALSHHLINSL